MKNTHTKAQAVTLFHQLCKGSTTTYVLYVLRWQSCVAFITASKGIYSQPSFIYLYSHLPRRTIPTILTVPKYTFVAFVIYLFVFRINQKMSDEPHDMKEECCIRSWYFNLVLIKVIVIGVFFCHFIVFLLDRGIFSPSSSSTIEFNYYSESTVVAVAHITFCGFSWMFTFCAGKNVHDIWSMNDDQNIISKLGTQWKFA